MTENIKRAKEVAILLVSEIDPDDVDAVEDGFDSLAANDFKVPSNIPQHAFHIPPEVGPTPNPWLCLSEAFLRAR